MHFNPFHRGFLFMQTFEKHASNCFTSGEVKGLLSEVSGSESYGGCWCKGVLIPGPMLLSMPWLL